METEPQAVATLPRRTPESVSTRGSDGGSGTALSRGLRGRTGVGLSVMSKKQAARAADAVEGGVIGVVVATIVVSIIVSVKSALVASAVGVGGGTVDVAALAVLLQAQVPIPCPSSSVDRLVLTGP